MFLGEKKNKFIKHSIWCAIPFFGRKKIHFGQKYSLEGLKDSIEWWYNAVFKFFSYLLPLAILKNFSNKHISLEIFLKKEKPTTPRISMVNQTQA